MVVVSAPKSNSRRLPNSGIASSSSSSSNTCTALTISFSKTREDNYLNKWDNPLFSPTAEETECIEISRTGGEDNAFGFKKLLADGCVLGVTSCDASQDEVGTSVLRLDMGGRNPQPPSPMQYRTSQSQDYYKRSLSSTTLSKFINANKQKKGSVVSSDSEESNQICTSQRWSNRHPVSDTMDGSNSARHRGNWDDRFSTCYFSGAEEKTIKTVSEHMKSDHATRHVDTDSGNETVGCEVWRANAEIQNAFQDERARKIFEELEVECGSKELIEIQAQILPEPKKIQMRKEFKPRRNVGIYVVLYEYGGRCRRVDGRSSGSLFIHLNVFHNLPLYRFRASISAFDCSYLSLDDSLSNVPVASPPVLESRSLPLSSSGTSTHGFSNSRLNNDKVLYNQVDGTHNFDAFDSATNSNCGGRSEYDLAAPSTQKSRTSHFSFTHELTSAARVHPGIKSYTEMFKREIQKDGGDCKFVRLGHSDEHSYELQLQAEALLFERVLLRNRIRSGVLLLCDPRL